MTRFEATAVLAIAALIGAVNSPVLAQRTEKGQAYIEIDGGTKQVNAEVRGPNGKAKPGKAQKSQAAAAPEKPVEPTFTATGDFENSKEKARETAIAVAVEKLRNYLRSQNPPIYRMPMHPRDFVRKMLIEKQETVIEENYTTETPGPSGTMYKMTVAVKVNPENLRELRSQERSSEALWILAGLGGLAGLVAVFFRIDAWTKGYLTSWLVLGTVGATTLLAGLWWWAK